MYFSKKFSKLFNFLDFKKKKILFLKKNMN